MPANDLSNVCAIGHDVLFPFQIAIICRFFFLLSLQFSKEPTCVFVDSIIFCFIIFSFVCVETQSVSFPVLFIIS